MEWVYEVLERKGLEQKSTDRIQRYYNNSCTILIVNNIPSKAIYNKRLTLRQGDHPCSKWFGFAINQLLHYLDKRLKGIQIFSKPILGPSLEHARVRSPYIESKYKLIGYWDDVIPAVTSMEEFKIINKAVALFEKASGCLLHRGPM